MGDEATGAGDEAVGATEQALSGILPVGTATVVSPEVRCDTDSARYNVVSNPTTTYCREVSIHCNSLTNGSDTDTGNDIIVQLAVRTPTAPVGVAVFHSGADGTTWPDAGYAADAYLRGLRTVKMRWKSDRGGWQDGKTTAYDGKGLRAYACRPATAFKYVYDTFGAGSAGMPTSGVAFCGHGKSGGAGALAYALTSYGEKDIFDYAQVVAGPPYMKIDMGCTGIRPEDEFGIVPFDSCPAFFPTSAGGETPPSTASYMFQGANPRANMDRYHGTTGTYGCGIETRPSPDPNAEIWAANSVLHTFRPRDTGFDSDFDYPQTQVDVNLCRTNANATYWESNLYYKALTIRSSGPKAVHCWGDLSNTAHSAGQNYDDCDGEVYASTTVNGHTVTGAALTNQYAQMAAGCVPRHGQ